MYNPDFLPLRLAVCDDEASCCDQIAQWTQAILRDEGLEGEIDCFPNGQALLDAMEAGASFSILLLDVMMDGKDGMTLAASHAFLFFTVNTPPYLGGFHHM